MRENLECQAKEFTLGSVDSDEPWQVFDEGKAWSDFLLERSLDNQGMTDCREVSLEAVEITQVGEGDL